MPFPILAMAAVMAATSVASTAMSVAGSITAGKGASAAANKKADNVIFESRFKINDIERQRLNVLSIQRATYASSGVTLSGSPLEVLAETNRLASFDIARLRFQAEEEAIAYRTTGAAQQKAALVSALGTGLAGVGQAASGAMTGYQLGKTMGF